MTKAKKFVAAAAAALTVGVLSIGAAAAETPQSNNAEDRTFYYRIPDRGSYETELLTKTNDNDYATVRLNTTSTASSQTPVQARVYRDGYSYAVTDIVSFSAPGSKYLPYKDDMGVNGARYSLYMNVGYYGVTVDGYWYP